jgi:hypothetical protein
MVKAAIVHHYVKAARLDWRQKRVAHDQSDSASEAGPMGPFSNPPERRGVIVQAHCGKSTLGEKDCVSSLAAPEVQHATAPKVSLEASRHADDRRRGPHGGPGRRATHPVYLRKVDPLTPI